MLRGVVLALLGAGVLFLGVIFVIASAAPGKIYRLPIGLVLTAVGLVLLYIGFKPKPTVYEVKVTWSPGGKVAAVEVKCPRCGASIKNIEPGKEYVECPYCGATLKLVEEPIW